MCGIICGVRREENHAFRGLCAPLTTYAVPCIRVPDGDVSPDTSALSTEADEGAVPGSSGANLIVILPFLPLGFEHVNIPARCSGFGLFISVSLQAYLKQVQLFFLILQPGVKGWRSLVFNTSKTTPVIALLSLTTFIRTRNPAPVGLSLICLTAGSRT